MEKFIITTEKCFYTKDGSVKNAVWGKVVEENNQLTIGENNKEIYIKASNVIAVLRCDEKPVELNEIGIPESRECFLSIYIAE